MEKHGRSGGSGFTLIEMLVLLAMVVVLQTLAAPALSGFVDSMRLTAGANSFLSSVHLARNEAAKRNARVVLCKSATGDACTRAGGWEQGWLVFHDVNNNAALDAGEALLSREQALPRHIRFSGNSQLANYLSYTQTGAASLTSGAFQAGTLTLCAQSATRVEARQVIISSTGRPRTVRTTVAQCP